MTLCRPFVGSILVILMLVGFSGPSLAQGGEGSARYLVTVTNITRGQTFTPVIVISHQSGVRLFQLGQPAISQLATLAEEGDVGPLMALAQASPLVFDIATTGAPPSGFVKPGESRTLMVRTRGNFDHLSLAAMLIPTNDAFMALNGVEGPHGRGLIAFDVPAYDSGSERNDETCASIPGPFFIECGGPGGGGQPAGGEEGYVHVHAGIHGIGDLVASERDWRNPVARITIRRLP